jgi:hypothetical protein
MAIPRLSLGNSAIQALIQNKAAVREFPFLTSTPKVAAKTCGSCGGSGVKMVPNYNKIKKHINNLSGQSKKRLKTLLNTAEVVMTFRDNKVSKTVRF